MVVHQQQRGSHVAGHEDVGPAVLVGIDAECRQSVGAAQCGNAGLARDIGEGSVAVVAVEVVLRLGQAQRAAHRGHALVIAVGNSQGGFGSGGQIDFKIVGDEKIEMAVAVVIHKSAAGAVARFGVHQSGLGGHIGEGAVAVIAVEPILSVVGEEEILPAVVVVVAHADALGPAWVGRARTSR